MLLEFTHWTVIIPFLVLGQESDGDIGYLLNYTDYTYDSEEAVENVTVSVSNNDKVGVGIGENHFYNYQGDLVGWRNATTVEFPYVVSIMHAEYLVHVCTGILVTPEAVLTFMRCVIRRKIVAGKVSQKLAELATMTIVAGVDNMTRGSNKEVLFRDVIDMVTPHANNFKGQVIFLMVRPVSYTLRHRPVKLYSTDVDEMSRKFEEEAQNGFCEIVTWIDTVVCPDGSFLKPANLQAYRVKIGDPELCAGQTHLLGMRTIGEWSIGSESKVHCFVGLGGRRCGTTPGAPIVCQGAVYGITSLGSSCSEFGDYGYFVPLNSSEIRLLYDRAYPIERSAASPNAYNTRTVHFWLGLLYIFLRIETR